MEHTHVCMYACICVSVDIRGSFRWNTDGEVYGVYTYMYVK